MPKRYLTDDNFYHDTYHIKFFLVYLPVLVSDSFKNYSLHLGQGCGNSRIFYLSRDKSKAKIYLSIENLTCPKEQISLYATVFKQLILSKTV